MTHDLSPLSGSSSDGDKQNLSSSPSSDGVCVLLYQTIAVCTIVVYQPLPVRCFVSTHQSSRPVSTKVVGVRLLANDRDCCCGARAKPSLFWRVNMGRLDEDRETGVWADERWAPQLQRVTKQPPSLLVSDSLVLTGS